MSREDVICTCRHVTKGDVRDAMKAGADCFKDVRKATGAGGKCGKCKKVCPMDVEVCNNSRKRENATECILCYECTKVCPKKALK